ncbi:DUF5605 domain-containing protein [Paenibacillus radicis (ex Xue et al. 2023)]|uniref:DUF5060 domain-containing protein n=1 Tax=Paenibacillus radicis (ex Xue et al. 2023) TaxID=2972489 RepID=A0ABT1YDM7_9BACL|nr:DUF5060 domain-containing protein [Paenibacillus radicis (ex Xue et al. 2023)]MCR8630524.1 DUF5060 domain-containing protein [Paenibacillus radicis (ex Xue et al. 2023)]
MREAIQNVNEVERWGLFELSLRGTVEGNPFQDVQLEAQFQHKHRIVKVEGFYDGNDMYKIRFMPDTEGVWTYSVSSSSAELDGAAGSFSCIPASSGNHGPVRIRDASHFVYEDGTAYRPFGTTCYAWTHQDEELQQQTLESLSASPFNKIRMCVFPKNYSFNLNEPVSFPFAGSSAEGFDWTRFNPDYFANLEQKITELQQLGIEADLILFHPYDKGRWGFDRMDAETDAYYLRYIIARLGAFRNIWWSLANEFDFMTEKTMDDWDRSFRIVQESDPYQHLRSIHNGTKMYDPTTLIVYDHTKPWVTHVSMQYWELTPTNAWRKLYGKPVVVDECCYEGNLPQRWGNITGEDMTARFWDGFTRGGYVGHGETFLHPDEVVWWSKGGLLYGESPARIAFLQQILNEAPDCTEPIDRLRDAPTIGVEGEYYLQYFGIHRPAYRELPLPENRSFQIDVIDTWRMTVTSLEGTFSGMTRIDMPGTPYIAIRARATEQGEV